MVDFDKVYKYEKDTLIKDIEDIIKIVFKLTTNKGITQYIYRINKFATRSDSIKLKVQSLLITLTQNGDYLRCEVDKIFDTLEDDISIAKFKIHNDDLIKQFKHIVQSNNIIEKYNKEKPNMDYVSQVVRNLKDKFSYYNFD